jgi:hypothetical protein
MDKVEIEEMKKLVEIINSHDPKFTDFIRESDVFKRMVATLNERELLEK